MLAKGEKKVIPAYSGDGILRLYRGNLEVCRSSGKPGLSLERGGLSISSGCVIIMLTVPGSGQSRMHVLPALYKLDPGKYKVELSDTDFSFGVQLFNLTNCQLIPYRYSLNEGLENENLTTKGASRLLDAGWVTAGEYEFSVTQENAYVSIPFKRRSGNLKDDDVDKIRAAFRFSKIE